MPITEFLHAINEAGIQLIERDGRLQLRGPAGAITPEIKAGAVAHKPAILALLDRDHRLGEAHQDVHLAPEEVEESEESEETEEAEESEESNAQEARPGASSLIGNARVTISGKDYSYQRRWQGDLLLPSDDYVAFDTETEVIDDLRREIPRLALASASAGDQASCLIHPDDVGSFILAHRHLHFVCHHAAFDFWVIEDHLRRHHEEEARRAWWQIAEMNRLHDSMLLEMLVRLAKDDSDPKPRNLAIVAKQYARMEIAKDDPYRMRYGEIIDSDWSTIEEGFFQYAVKDAIVTRPAYLALRQQALVLAAEYDRYDRDLRADARERFGLLTEAVQVKKAIALARIERNGMCLDRQRLQDAEAELRQQLNEAAAQVQELCPALYKRNKAGALICTKAGTPSKSTKVLADQLQKVADEVKQQAGIELNIPRTSKTDKPTTSTKFWQEYAEHHPFLRHWIAAEESAKMLQFFGKLQDDRVHPSYVTLIRSGRTACAKPNVQQIPRDGALRQAFIASPGHFLLTVDYSFIELRTLAAVASQRYGWSDLGDVIKAGVDPHAHTAAMMLGVPPDEFLSWKHDPSHAAKYAAARQMAKPINFGVPGGLGVASLISYAHRTYGVTLTFEQAKERRELLTKHVYKELDLYLAEDGTAIVARSLKAPLPMVRQALGDLHLSCIRKVLTGNPKRVDGVPYQEDLVARIWAALASVNCNPELQEALENRQPSAELAAHVCQAGVVTLTGRIRGRVRYSQARNSPFQGLAADGAALALFALVKEGFRIVGFVHDEVLIELPDEGGFVREATVRRVEEIMCREMEKVLVGGIPVACEAALATRWNKKAKLVVRDGKVFPWDDEGQDPQTPVKTSIEGGLAA
jgi:DNA polymerase I-like protein with 3'-5' exonuclease and polymerase domains